MRTFGVALLTCVLLSLLTGCWNRMELDTYAFVQGVAIDQAEDGENIELTIQFYKPVSGGGQSKGIGPSGESLINIKSRGETVFEAIRDMTIHFGRKPQWSHMRVLIIGEDIAKKRNIAEILDFFARDNEPRATVSVMIGKNKADIYLKDTKPLIESTVGQQLRESERMAYQYTGKTTKTSFLDLMLDLKSETGVATMPFVYFDPKNVPLSSPVTRLALLKNGKMVDTVASKNIESLLLLLDKYKQGIIEVDCPDQSKKKKKMEAVEVESAKTKLDIKIKDDSAAVHVSTHIIGYAAELICTSLRTPEDVMKFNERVKSSVEEDLKSALAYIQKERLDVFGIGNRIYRQDPALWKRWKPDWEERFSNIPFTIEVEVNIINTGANLGLPIAK